MHQVLRRHCSVIASIIFVSGCATYEVRTTDLKPADRLEIETPEQLLLDVGIQIFEPDIEDVPGDEVIYLNVRESESIWVAQRIKTTLESTKAWGAVRVVPDDKVITDLQVHGKVVQSDGEVLKLRVKVTDAAGSVWIDREYDQLVSKYSYDLSQSNYDPFQGLYNEISNDMLDLLKETPLDYRADLRAISAVRFAQSFSPEAFDQYLVFNDEGQYEIDRLPAENDPMFQRVQQIQLRDQMFVDVLQDYYLGFSDNMENAYREWRAQSYEETKIIRDLEGAARARRVGGWLSILAGAFAQFDDSSATRIGGAIGIYGGVETLRSSYQKRDEAALHIETLSELGQSLESELEPSVIELQDRTVTLTGTVRNQYDDWRKILSDIYYQETGYQRPEPGVDTGLYN